MTEFISRKYGNDGYDVIIKTDSHEHYKASEEFARRLIDHAKPMTNADRIRAMSDEELATLLSELCQNGENCYSCPLFGKSCGGINGLSGWLDWAKRPAEVDNG